MSLLTQTLSVLQYITNKHSFYMGVMWCLQLNPVRSSAQCVCVHREVCLSLCVCTERCVCVCLSVSVYVCAQRGVCVSVCLYVHRGVSVCVCVHRSVCLSLYVSVPCDSVLELSTLYFILCLG